MSLFYILSTMLREEELIERPNVIQIFEIKRIAMVELDDLIQIFYCSLFKLLVKTF